jgi:hypothetical protein
MSYVVGLCRRDFVSAARPECRIDDKCFCRKIDVNRQWKVSTNFSSRLSLMDCRTGSTPAVDRLRSGYGPANGKIDQVAQDHPHEQHAQLGPNTTKQGVSRQVAHVAQVAQRKVRSDTFTFKVVKIEKMLMTACHQRARKTRPQ